MKSSKYNHTIVEKKWQEVWLKENPTSSRLMDKGKKIFVLDMFPYPSASTMHVGHLEGYVGTDILCRYLRMNKFEVLHPMGWDAFGLPAENYAIKTGIDPDKSTHKNIETFKRQLTNSGLLYDWDREIDTSDPDFYKWTQWLFLLMYKRGLAYKKKAPVNWCPKDETVLANEQVVDGKCERCDTPVVKKDLEQWFLKITDYSDRLIAGLEKIDWPEEVKVQQKNWIGRSEGMNLKLGDLEVFTTRPDTLRGATFIAVAFDHPMFAGKYKFDPESKEKEGEFTGKYEENPLTKKKMPVWAVNYVDKDYGTGIIMGVPYLDERDMDFAKKYHLDIVEIEPDEAIWGKAEKVGWGKRTLNYHLRDWLVSRQRYWGCPIPMVYCDECGWQPVPEKDLPVTLPKDVDFLPHGESPLARSKSFQEGVVCPKCGAKARREVDTMDTYVDSSWYFIRFVDPGNKKAFASLEAIKKWLPVDIYVGGGHVVQHLLFARFFWKVLFDAGLIGKSLGDEPFLKLRAPGWILGPDSRKMSKRWENVITPDDVIPKFGADTLRVYEMFMGPFEVMKPWSIAGVEGISRFLLRLWRVFNAETKEKVDKDVEVKLHQTIKKVTSDIPNLKYNTAISSIMELVNIITEKGADKDTLSSLCLILAPFAPHLGEEVWREVLDNKTSVHLASWPSYDEKLALENEVSLPIQVNGKVRSQITLERVKSNDRDLVEGLAREDEKISKWLKGTKVNKVIFVPGRLINFALDGKD